MRYGEHYPPMSLSTVIARYRAHIVKLVRYASVSVVSTATSLTVLAVLIYVFAFPAGWSNAIATSIATIPSFELNRRWVWSRHDQRLVFRQVVPFAALSFTGLVLSTINAHFVGLWTATWGRGERTIALGLTNVATFGALWVFQFFLCDRVLFRDRSGQAATVVIGGAGSLDEGDLGEAEPAPGPAADPDTWDLDPILEAAGE